LLGAAPSDAISSPQTSPVVTCAASHQRTMQTTLAWYARLSPDERADFFLGGTSERFYAFDSAR